MYISKTRQREKKHIMLRVILGRVCINLCVQKDFLADNNVSDICTIEHN
jgi:hypothetical protein